MRTKPTIPARKGFSLLELILALLIFQVGLLAVVGMVLTAQSILMSGELVLRGTLEGITVADSVMEGGGMSQGEVERPWGWIRWEPSGGALKVVALNSAKDDTVALLRVWTVPRGVEYRFPLLAEESMEDK